MISRRILLLLALGVGLAGCGSGGGTAGTATTSPTTTTAPVPSAADQSVARDAQLRLTDFPSGWEQKDSAPGSKSEARCPSVEAVKAMVSAHQGSPAFERNSPEAQSAIYIFADVPTATRAFGELSGESTRRCFADAVTKAAASENQQNVEFGQITTGQLSMASLGDESAAGRLTIPIKTSGLTVRAYVDLVFVRANRGIAVLTFLDVLSPFEESLRNRLATSVVDRLKTGLAQSSG